MAIVATVQSPDLAQGASPACAVPDGTAHALEPGAGHTWCGIDAAQLTPWPEFAWPPSGMAAIDTCPRCERVADDPDNAITKDVGNGALVKADSVGTVTETLAAVATGRRRHHSRARPDVLAGIALGGMLGASARYGIEEWLATSPGRVPWATLGINLSGSFLLGFLLVLLLERSPRASSSSTTSRSSSTRDATRGNGDRPQLDRVPRRLGRRPASP